MGYHYKPTGVDKISNTGKIISWQGCGVTEISFIVGGDIKLYTYFGRQFGGFLQN